MRFVDELKRRNVFRVGGAYAVVFFGMVQLTDPLVSAYHLPEWSTTFVFTMMLLGLPVTLVAAWAFEMTPEGLRRTQDVDQHRHIGRAPANVGDYLILATMIGICGYLYYQVEWTKEADDAPVTLNVRSMAVLPFANLSVEPEQEGVSRALTAEVRNRLTRLPGLRVLADSAAAKPEEDHGMKAVGEELGVNVVLDGSVQRAGDRLRVMAQLVDTKHGVQLWSKTFNRNVADILSVQDDLSQAIVDDVRRVITHEPQDEDDVAGAKGSPAAAQKALASGRQSLGRRTGKSLAAALSAFEQTIALAPKTASAYAGIAETILLQGQGAATYGAVPVPDAVARARPLVAKALVLNPKLAEARAVDGFADLVSGDADGAIGKLNKAVAAKPDLAKAHLWLYRAYLAAGRPGDGIPHLEQAYHLQPDSLAIGLNMSRLLALSDRRLGADMLLDRLERLYPGDENLLVARGARLADDWRPVDAAEMLRRANAADPSDRRARRLLGMIYLDLGAAEEAASWLKGDGELVLLAEGRAADAVAEAQRRFAANPGDPERIFALADAEAAAGNDRAVIDLLGPFEGLPPKDRWRLFTRTPFMPAITLAAARLAVGDAAAAKTLLEESRRYVATLRRLGFDYPYLAYVEARIDALEGDRDGALAALRSSVSHRFPGVSVVGWDPALRSLRGLAEFQAITADLDADRARLRDRLHDLETAGSS
ncbi:MAG: tetratricopeptide repeat protein [Alphaproteobacteria bacterium]|nr:tetratricopeptide repeat protein [Alphaproteobacteria bacterium]